MTLSIPLVSLFVLQVASAEDPPEVACPDGVVAADGWPGEYPSPVVQVTETLEVPVRAHPCAPEPTEVCVIDAGLYHPWVKDEATNYVTVRPVGRFRATRSTRMGQLRVRKGTTVEMTQEVGEGFCVYRVGTANFQHECPDMMGGRVLTPVKTTEGEPTQMVQVECDGGSKGWLAVDEALMERTAVREGAVVEFGKVGPAQPQ